MHIISITIGRELIRIVVVVLLLQLHVIFLCNKDLLLGLNRVVVHRGLSCLGVEANSRLSLGCIAVSLD